MMQDRRLDSLKKCPDDMTDVESGEVVSVLCRFPFAFNADGRGPNQTSTK